MKNILKTYIKALTLKNGNNVYADMNTFAVDTIEKAGVFLKIQKEDGRFYIYSVGKQKWLSYTKSTSYTSGQNKITLVNKKEEAGVFVFETNNTAGTFQIRPILENDTKANQFLNWYGGAGVNRNKTIGFYTDDGNIEAGSRWIFSPVEREFETIDEYTFSSQRMGKVPTITSTIRSFAQIDDFLKGDYIHAIYLGEKYLLVNSPSASQKSEDARFEYKLEFVAERFVLENVYLYDTELKTTDVKFSGTIHQYADFVNKSLEYNGLNYRVRVDAGVSSESKFFALSDASLAAAMQESYKQYEIPYYYIGEEIHFGFSTNAIEHKFKYGHQNELITIQKNPVGNKIINRCTGVGSEDNIPYYYPNKHPLGEVDVYLNDAKKNDVVVNLANYSKVANDTVLTYAAVEHTEYSGFNMAQYSIAMYLQLERSRTTMTGLAFDIKHTSGYKDMFLSNRPWYYTPLALVADSAAYLPHIAERDKKNAYSELEKSYCYYKDFNPLTETLNFATKCYARAVLVKIDEELQNVTLTPQFSLQKLIQVASENNEVEHDVEDITSNFKTNIYYIKKDGVTHNGQKYDAVANGNNGIPVDEMADRYIICVFEATGDLSNTVFARLKLKFTMTPPQYTYRWENEKGKIIKLSDYGLKYDTPVAGDTFTFKTRAGSLMPFQKHLMPPIYRSTFGEQSFYNAENNKFVSPESGEFYEFSFLYSDSDRREHKETFDFIKPSIEHARFVNENGVSLPINMFVDFAYDLNDNDDIDHETEEYRHSYFFGKLRPLGFNLFDCANENGDMTISMTSGPCGGCKFVIGVDEGSKKNTVQVDKNGDLVYDGDKVKLGEAQDVQNDTTNNYVWIALKKDNSTYDGVRPNATYKYRPKACSAIDTEDGDTFVITNILFPETFIYEAEQRLEEEIIAYMKENNEERFTFSIKFSRIFLAENPEIEQQLNDSATIVVSYNGFDATLYVTGYTYKVLSGEALPEITVELDDELKFEESYIQKALSSVEQSVISRVDNMDFVKQALSVFLQKTTEDYALAKTHFTRGVTLGLDGIAEVTEEGRGSFISQIIKEYISTPQFIDGFAGCGFKLWLDDKGKSNLTVDNFTVREAFNVFEMIIAQLRAVNGGLFISAANGKIQSVVEDKDNYYILLENENTFMIGDYMRCQILNGTNIVNYWVEICGINGNTCVVAKSEFNGAVPVPGQEVVLDGSKIESRQGAIHISATDGDRPRIDILSGIKTKSHNDCVRVRLGDLSEIQDDAFGENQPKGHGLYSDNVYLKGEFILKNSGKSVDTLFAITEDGIKASVEQTQSEAIRGKSFLYNASFTKGFEGWLTSDESSMYWNNGSLLTNNNSVLTKTVTISGKPIYDNVFFATIDNGWIKQPSTFYVDKPNFEEGKKYPLVFSANVRCEKSGVLNVQIVGGAATNAKSFKGISSEDYFEEYVTIAVNNIEAHTFSLIEGAHLDKGDEFLVDLSGETPRLYNTSKGIELRYNDWREEQVTGEEEQATTPAILVYSGVVESNNDFKSIDVDNLAWSGSGDFYLSFTGKADFYGLTIYTDKTEVRNRTFFDMSDRLISFGAQQLNADGTISKESGIVVQPEGAGLYAKDKNGNQSRIAAYSDGKVVLEGSEIQLKGNLTADGKFKVREDGSIEAKNGSFSGYLINKPLKVTEDNYREFFRDHGDNYASAWEWSGWLLCSCVMLKYTSAMKNGSMYGTTIELPCVDANTVNVTEDEIDIIRSFIGQNITIYNDNNTNKTLIRYYTRYGNATTNYSVELEAYTFATFNCKVAIDAYGQEMIYWEMQTTGKIKQIDNYIKI